MTVTWGDGQMGTLGQGNQRASQLCCRGRPPCSLQPVPSAGQSDQEAREPPLLQSLQTCPTAGVERLRDRGAPRRTGKLFADKSPL